MPTTGNAGEDAVISDWTAAVGDPDSAARMTSAGRDGIAEVMNTQQAVTATGAPLELLPGSLRTPRQILALATPGVRNMTFGPEVWDLFLQDELTAASVEQFEELGASVS